MTNSGLTTPLPNGTVHLIMNVDNLTGTCSAKVTTTKGGSSTVATETISSTGTYVSGALSAQTALGIFPARTLSKIELICTAGNSMTVDWLSIQNTDDIYPPSSEVSVAWKDVEAPGGGLSTTVVRTGASFTSYAGSDLGGVARWSDWDEGWTTINGEGATGLTSQAALGVWDILAVTGALYKLGASTYANDIDASGTIGFGEWAADFMIAGKYEDATSSTKNCSVARVRLWGNTTSPSYDWDWFPLDKDASSPNCDVDEENILGVVASPWSDEAWVFGSYVHFPENGRGAGTPQQSFGGACTLDITDNSVAATRLVDPATHRYTIADIAPNPYITDSLLVVPQVDAAVWFECNEYAVSGVPPSLGCPDIPAPFILERLVSTWNEVTFGELPPSLIGTAGAWAPIGANGPTILYATEGASAWQGVMSW